ncbi:ABC transporter substrate-binding protein [Methylibium sp. Root1272]|uniref:ABC transporter substrate-binding protein n=1 Tax=Methylibium sp. Root1272 TaxID=1736441 RepID=UPI0006F7BFE4|nr:ABC transporter substrate-binding protein [Methylibium sp. Root1272]KQW70072.1 hypothetical protein ASC67_06240 [Methylibium sp. Root1272]
MKKLYRVGVALLLAHGAADAATTELVVDYPYPGIFKTLQEDLANRFTKANPDVSIKFTAPATDYEQANQRVLLQAVTGQTPDITFQGLNRQRVLIDKGIPVDLTPLAASDAEYAGLGLNQNLLKIGQFSNKQYGLPFSISTPIVYINTDLIRRAGGDPASLPGDWDGLFALAAKVNALGGGVRGFHYDWDISGNWLWQALVYSHGGVMASADERRVQFGDPAGQAAIKRLGEMRSVAGMKDVPYTVSVQDFIAGNLGIWVQTTAFLGNVTRQVGDKFAFKTVAYPLGVSGGKVPAGGNVAMMLTKDPQKQKAAWRYLKFLASPEAATLMVKTTGYFPANDTAITKQEFLADFYKSNENYRTALKQLNYVATWYAFPGQNGLKITDVIQDGLHSVVAGRAAPDVALNEIVEKTQKLLDR